MTNNTPNVELKERQQVQPELETAPGGKLEKVSEDKPIDTPGEVEATPEVPKETPKASAEKMTLQQKITLLISLIALSISALTYFKTDATMEAFNHRGKLDIIYSKPGLTITSPPEFRPGENVTMTARVIDSTDIDIINIGDLPAKDVRIAVQYDSSVTDPVLPEFKPPVPVEVTKQNSATFITLKLPIAPKEKLHVSFPTRPEIVSVANEHGERSAVAFPKISKVEFYSGATRLGEARVDSNNNASLQLNTK